MPRLSLIVITKNEEAAIARCLRSANFADEMVVFDHGSTDRTVEIARAEGARVTVTPDWPGFGPQKNRALQAAAGDWIPLHGGIATTYYFPLYHRGQQPTEYRKRQANYRLGAKQVKSG